MKKNLHAYLNEPETALFNISTHQFGFAWLTTYHALCDVYLQQMYATSNNMIIIIVNDAGIPMLIAKLVSQLYSLPLFL